MFTVEKRDGGLKPIFDLIDLNVFLNISTFHMVSVQLVLQLLKFSSWFAVIDLKDTYFHISFPCKPYIFLHFSCRGHVFQYTVLPFDLATVPRIFSTCMAPVVLHLFLRGCNIFPYLDNSLVTVDTSEQLSKHCSLVLDLYCKLSLLINWEKSRLTPSQIVQFIGSVLDSV